MQLLADLRYAWRGLRRAPIFTVVAVLSIALGIGANTAIFTLLDQVALRLLPVKEPAQLVLLTSTGSFPGSVRARGALSYPAYVDLRDETAPRQVFSGVFCRFGFAMHASIDGRTESIAGELVSGSYFPVLGVGAAIGRTIGPEDDERRGGHPVAMLGYAYWTSRFGRDPSILGRTIRLNDQPMTIIGVTQAGFEGTNFDSAPQVYVPIMMKAQITPGWDDLDNRRSKWVSVFGRLRPDVDADRADAMLQPFYRAMIEREISHGVFANASADAIAELRRSRLQVQNGSQGRLDARLGLARPLWVLMACVCGVLLIACANVANLLLARAMTRQREVAVRLALGASRGRLVRHLLVESLLLALLGASAGVGLATLGTRVLLGFLVREGDAIPLTAALDWRVLAFTAAIAIATGLIFGLVPALQSTRPRLAPTLASSSRGVAGGGALHLKKALVIAQVALSLLLLIGAGLFTRSLRNLTTIDPGFRTDRLLTFTLNPGLSGYTGARRPVFYKAVRDRLEAAPGITSVAFSNVPTLGGQTWASTITIEGYQPKPGEEVTPLCNAVSPGYFRTLGIPFVAGRDFTAAHERDDEPGPDELSYHAVIVSETFAKRYFGDAPAHAVVGRHIGFTHNPGAPTPIEIIGVVKDAKYDSVREERASVLYFPYLEDAGNQAFYYARTTPEMRPETQFGAVRRVVQEIDPNLPVVLLRTLAMQIQGSLASDRMIATLSLTFSVLATLLAMVGLYGVTAYSVTQRTREIGIRMALGATTHGVAAAIAHDVAGLVAIGVAIALPAAWAIGGYVRAQLYGVSPTDPLVMILMVMVLATSAGLAGVIPARRAARIDPVGALRQD